MPHIIHLVLLVNNVLAIVWTSVWLSAVFWLTVLFLGADLSSFTDSRLLDEGDCNKIM